VEDVGRFQAVLCEPCDDPASDFADGRGAAREDLTECAEGARAKAQDKQVIAAVTASFAMLGAQLSAIRRLRKK